MVHYRMTGKIEHTDQQQTKSARLSWQLEDDSWLTFKDRRKLGQVEWCDHDEDPKVQWPLLAKMGPEPHDLKSGDELANRMGKKSRRSLKAALLDQTVLAGVGNIAVSELFWRLRIHPETKVNQLREEDFDALHAEMPIYFDWLTNLQESENLAYLNEGKHVKNPFSAYARPDQECERCKTTSIEQLTVGGRSTYYCPTCQPKRT